MIIDRGQARSPVAYKAASLDWIFTTILIGYEAGLHSTAGRARWGGGVPERCAASELSQSSRGARGDSIGDQPGGPLRAFIEQVKYRSIDAPRNTTTARKSRKLKSST